MAKASVILGAGLAAVAACASDLGHIEVDGSTLNAPDTVAPIPESDPTIGINDVLTVRVFDVPELSGAYQVGYDGRIKVPLIGQVSAAGATPFELAADLEARLGREHLQDPDVSVAIAEGAGSHLTVDGSVENPGVYPVRGQLTLLQAVALSGGPSDGANPNKVVVFRTIDGERAAAAFDLSAIRNGLAHDPVVYGNDIIVVDGSEARRAWGEVLRTVPLLALFAAF
ncbi:MAG: polysaccharide biosynthesis/export family protein [Pseudomonadota bacterium]